MATIRKRKGKWQVQVRRKDAPSVSKIFTKKPDAVAWGYQMEVLADKGLLRKKRHKQNSCYLKDLLRRYCQEVTPKKRCGDYEDIRTCVQRMLPRSFDKSRPYVVIIWRV